MGKTWAVRGGAQATIALALSLPALLSGCKPKLSAQEIARQEAAKAKEQAERERYERMTAEFKQRDEEGAKRREAMFPDSGMSNVATSDDSRATRRELLAMLAKDPLAQRPLQVLPPNPSEGEIWTTYVYQIDGLGKVSQWRTDKRDWEIIVSTVQDADIFAPNGGSTLLARVGDAVSWWRIVLGPFADCFVMTSPGGTSVKSKDNACRTGGPAVLRAACGLR